MTTSTRAFALAVAVAVMAAVLVGTPTGSGEAGAATQHTLRIPAAAFTPNGHSVAYSNIGELLMNNDSELQGFVAPVFLEGTTATIHSVRLHYYDNGPGEVCMWARRINLDGGGIKTMSSTCSKKAVDRIRSRVDTTIKADTVGSDAAVYLVIDLSAGVEYALSGVTIVYTSDL